MLLLTINWSPGIIQKQSERLTAVLREHSEPQLDRIEDGHNELAATVEQLRRELFAVGLQLRVLAAARVAPPGKPKGPWEV